MMLTLIFLAGIWAGTQNALAGGGSFVTLPALMFAGLSPFAANLTSTVALFPGQITTGLANRKMVSDAPKLPFRALFVISLVGGALGAALLLNTPDKFFARLLPWLVMFATLVCVWGNFIRKPAQEKISLGGKGTAITQFGIAIYGGYFGGGIGLLMLAALTMAGMQTRIAAATKNVLAGVMNASAVALFVFSPDVHWIEAGVLGIGAIIGGAVGAKMLNRFPEKLLRVIVVVIGTALTIGLFLRPV